MLSVSFGEAVPNLCAPPKSQILTVRSCDPVANRHGTLRCQSTDMVFVPGFPTERADHEAKYANNLSIDAAHNAARFRWREVRGILVRKGTIGAGPIHPSHLSTTPLATSRCRPWDLPP